MYKTCNRTTISTFASIDLGGHALHTLLRLSCTIGRKRICTRMHTRTCTHTHAHMHMHMHTHAHTHMHACNRTSKAVHAHAREHIVYVFVWFTLYFTSVWCVAAKWQWVIWYPTARSGDVIRCCGVPLLFFRFGVFFLHFCLQALAQELFGCELWLSSQLPVRRSRWTASKASKS